MDLNRTGPDNSPQFIGRIEAIEQRLTALEQLHHEQIELYRSIQIDDEEEIRQIVKTLAELNKRLNKND